MITDKKQHSGKFIGTLLRWLALSLLFVGTHALAQSAGTVTYVYTDPQGTPLAEADASGNVTATFEYTPYGTYAPQGTSNPGASPIGPGYTGHVNDPETNLVYMQARYYDSTTGRFLSVDPLSPTSGNVFDFNRFVYVNNNPINHIDPNGRCIEDACIGEAILLGEAIDYAVSAYEASQVVVATSEVASASAATATATTSATMTAAETAAACAKNVTCVGLAVTAGTELTSKVVQEIQKTSTVQLAKEHTKNARPSTKGKHEKGGARKKQDAGGEKGDENRRPPSKRPPGTKGPWPPKPPKNPAN